MFSFAGATLIVHAYRDVANEECCAFLPLIKSHGKRQYGEMANDNKRNKRKKGVSLKL